MAVGRILSAFTRRRSSDAVGLYLTPKSVVLAQLAYGTGDAVHLKVLNNRPLPSAGDITTLRTAVKEARLGNADCVLTLDASSYSLLQVEKPNVPQAELLAAVRWRIRDLIAFPLEDAVVDAFEVPGLENRGRPPSLYVAAARKSELKPLVDTITAVGLRLSRINIAELAMRNLAARLAGNEESVAVLSLGERSGVLVVLRDRALYVTRRLDLDANDAAALGGGEAGASGRRRLFDRIALEVQRTLDFFDSTFQKSPVRKIFVLVAAPGLEELPQALRDNLGVASSFADLGGALNATAIAIDAGHFATALAAAGAMAENDP